MTKARSSSKRKTKRESTQLMRRIRREAKALGLSTSEYLRLTLALSSALRESLGDTGIDSKTLLKFVESPMFSILLGSIAKTAINSVQRDASDEASKTPGEQETESTTRRPIYPQMHQPSPQFGQPGMQPQRPPGMQPRISQPNMPNAQNGQARPIPPRGPYDTPQPVYPSLYPYGYPY